MKKLSLVFSVALVLLALVATSISCTSDNETGNGNELEETYTLSMVTFSTKGGDTVGSQSCQLFVDRVKEKTDGAVIIDWKGGQEVIGRTDQAPAVRDGVIDILIGPMSFYEKLLPKSAVSNLSPFTPMEERENGIYDHWVEVHKEMNVRYLGIPHSPGQYYLFVNEEIKKPQTDFKGIKIRSNDTYNPFLLALGCVPATISQGELYGSLQTGVVDGTGWVPDSFAENKAYEVVKYWIDYGFYRTSSSVIVNLDAWNKLPEELQDQVEDASREIEAERWQVTREMDDDFFNLFKDEGMTPITFSSEDAEWYLDTAYNSKWEYAKGLLDEEYYNEVKSLLTQ
jgi:TRAP-type transport system periplasmic protein